MLKKICNIFSLEKKSVFLINSSLIILMIFFLYFNIPVKYFFYINMTSTITISYFFFKRSRLLSKSLILTNMFIFFYFLYPYIADFLFFLFESQSYLYILFYNILIAFIFLEFSSNRDEFLKNIKSVNLKLILCVFILGLFFGTLFYISKEPVPISLFNPKSSDYFVKIIIFTLILSISEQMIFSGFLFNTYKKLNTSSIAMTQTTIFFVMFHLLRFENLIISFIRYSDSFFLFNMIFYYILLGLFMITAIYLYNLNSSKYKGNIIYPIILHFITDLTIFVLIKFIGIY